MKKSAWSAILLAGMFGPSFSQSLPPTERRTKEEFTFLCAYKPENGLTQFASPKCGHPEVIAKTAASELRAEITAHWRSQSQMRYADLTTMNYATAFSRAYPQDKEPPPTQDEIHRFDLMLLCNWWRESKDEQFYRELVDRKTFGAKDLALIHSHDIGIGMTEAALFCSKGLPDLRNRTVTAAGAHIQYVFKRLGNDFLAYTENGIVVSWQD